MARDFIRSLPEHQRDATATWLHSVHIDPLMLLLLTMVVGYGLVVLYSAVDQSETLFQAQLLRMSVAFGALIVAAQLPPQIYVRWAPVVYVFGVMLLILVLLIGVKVKGSQRWLDIFGDRKSVV